MHRGRILAFVSAFGIVAANDSLQSRGAPCAAAAQEELDRAITLLHHMTYPQAREAFREVARRDARCVMAYWGVAMTLFQPVWPTRPGPAERELGWQMVQKAESLTPQTERERLLINAAAAFFKDPAGADYWQRIRRWEEAAELAYAKLPNDAEAASFYALAHLAVAPVSGTAQANHARAAQILERVLASHPRHAGAMHYLIHANDITARERQSPNVVRDYMLLAPDNPHALHMPTHIHVRKGDWLAAIDGNVKAAAAALKYPAGEQRQFVWDEFPHAIEYLVYSYLQRGADAAAKEQLTRLQNTPNLEPTLKTAFNLASIPARYALERQAWSEAAALVPRQPTSLPWDRFPWPEAVTVFARGLGELKTSQPQRAQVSHARLVELESAAKASGEPIFERNVRMLRLALAGRIAHASGDSSMAITLLRDAAELEEQTPKHAVTPAPTLPARELLGEMLAELGRHREALDEYTRALSLYPNRFNGLLGAARSARATGDSARAFLFYRQLAAVTDSGSRRAALSEVREFLSRARD